MTEKFLVENQSSSIIFHVPFKLDPKATSASGIRPYRMRKAFESLGFDVHEVSGTHSERRKQMQKLRRLIRGGKQFQFVYSEASTAPTGLREPVTMATSLTRDIRFLRWCRGRGIPVGLFYRDIYWMFDDFERGISKAMTIFLRWRYRADLRGYKSAVDRLYLPSIQMASYLPAGNRPQVAALPPGSDVTDSSLSWDRDLSLIYVGGLGAYYRLHEAVRGVEQAKHARLTICARENEWIDERDTYAEVLGESISVVHKAGLDLEQLYAESHIGVLFMESIPYREFAAPMKLYEYIGHGKPIIATEGSLAAELVETLEIGWTIPYTANALTDLLDRLSSNPTAVKLVAAQVKEQARLHTWEARAEQVASDLGAITIGPH